MSEKQKVLLVDDKIENLIALEKVLSEFNIKCVRALSGNEALIQTLKHDFAIALVDVRMPVMDGFETVQLMRQAKQTRYLPVIFISAVYTEEYHHTKGIKSGAVDFITKPIIPEILIGKVRIFLELNEQKNKLRQLLEKEEKMNILLKQEIESRKRAEKKLRDAKSQAEKENRLKSEFLANMSHEIRTPMNAIIGFADLISDVNLSKDSRSQYIQHINNSGANLLFLIDDIIDFAKIEAGKLKIVKKDFYLNRFLIGIVETYNQVKSNKGLDKVKLKLNCGLESNKSHIHTDPFRIRQVLANLLNNSLKFTKEGTIEIGYKIEADKDLVMYVKDTGKGISEEQTSMIFNRFEKGEYNEDMNYSGTGLGLHISKSIIKLLGGKIWVESKKDKGATFYFSIPYITGDKELPSADIPSHIPLKDYNWKDKVILIAEDEEINSKFLREALKSTKIKVIEAKNGKEAIEICIKNKNIDIVLMDIKMPVINGLEATVKIKKKRPELPIIAQTAFAMAGEDEKCKKAGCDDYISKPINRKILLNILGKYFNH